MFMFKGAAKTIDEISSVGLFYMFVTIQKQKPDQFLLKVNFSKTLSIFQNTLIFNVLEKIKSYKLICI